MPLEPAVRTAAQLPVTRINFLSPGLRCPLYSGEEPGASPVVMETKKRQIPTANANETILPVCSSLVNKQVNFAMYRLALK